MRDPLSIWNPNALAIERAKEKYLDELDIATEMYVTSQWCCIHYADIFGKMPKEMASKERLSSWLNDDKRNEIVRRSGIISLYKKECAKHFDSNGFWLPRFLPDFIMFMMQKLLSKEFIHNKSTAVIFKNSIINRDWFQNAIALSTLKLLEDGFKSGKIKSETAYARLGTIFVVRDWAKQTAAVIGKALKKGEQDEDFIQQIRDNCNRNVKKLIEYQLKLAPSNAEFAILKDYEQTIIKALEEIHKSAIKQIVAGI